MQVCLDVALRGVQDRGCACRGRRANSLTATCVRDASFRRAPLPCLTCIVYIQLQLSIERLPLDCKSDVVWWPCSELFRRALHLFPSPRWRSVRRCELLGHTAPWLARGAHDATVRSRISHFYSGARTRAVCAAARAPQQPLARLTWRCICYGRPDRAAHCKQNPATASSRPVADDGCVPYIHIYIHVRPAAGTKPQTALLSTEA